MELQAAGVGADGAIAADGNATEVTFWTVDEEKAANAAIWSGRFHDVNKDRSRPWRYRTHVRRVRNDTATVGDGVDSPSRRHRDVKVAVRQRHNEGGGDL